MGKGRSTEEGIERGKVGDNKDTSQNTGAPNQVKQLC